MALRLSTGLREAMMGGDAEIKEIVTSSVISFGDGDGTDSRDTINDSGNGLGVFDVDDYIQVKDSTSNDGKYRIRSVAAGIIEVDAGSFVNEVTGADVVLATAKGGSMKNALAFGRLDIYSGTQPLDADSAETGTLLVSITLGSGTFVPGTKTNGINLKELGSDASGTTLSKAIAEAWSGSAVASATAGWFRHYDNAVDTGISTSAVRADGAVGTSGAELNMSNTTISSGGTTSIDQADFTLPAV